MPERWKDKLAELRTVDTPSWPLQQHHPNGQRVRRTRWLPVSIVILLAMGAGVFAAISNGSTSPLRVDRLRVIGTEDGSNALLIPEDHPPYPDSWVSSASEIASAKVKAILPDTGAASAETATAYYISPDASTVSVTYQLPNPPTAEVRQDYLEVLASVWDGRDPATVLGDTLDASGIAGASMTQIDGVPTAVVAAHSATDMDRTNPAVLWFVVDGVEYQISGGDDMDMLTGIAKSIISSHQS